MTFEGVLLCLGISPQCPPSTNAHKIPEMPCPGQNTPAQDVTTSRRWNLGGNHHCHAALDGAQRISRTIRITSVSSFTDRAPSMKTSSSLNIPDTTRLELERRFSLDNQ
eukprot:753345-Hanusia_phi.AAC.2